MLAAGCNAPVVHRKFHPGFSFLLVPCAELSILCAIRREGEGRFVVWAVIIAGGTGLLLGRWLRVPAIVFASAMAVPAGVALTSLANWSLMGSLLYCAGLLVTLQIGFLAGGALACIRS